MGSDCLLAGGRQALGDCIGQGLAIVRYVGQGIGFKRLQAGHQQADAGGVGEVGKPLVVVAIVVDDEARAAVELVQHQFVVTGRAILVIEEIE